MESLLELVKKNEEWRGRQTLNLIASENVASPQVRRLMSSDLLHRYTAPDRFYMGTKFIDEITDLSSTIARQVFKAEYADPRPLSGHIADWILLSCFTKAGDSILSVSPEHGGYPGIGDQGVTRIMRLRNLYYPFNKERMNLKVDESAELIQKEKPRLVIFGASFILFPAPVNELAKIAKDVGATVAFDGAHVLGLIAGGKFQDPLHEGASILIGSTHKSLFGPQGGLILSDAPHGKIIGEAIFPSFVDNAHYNRIAALAMALYELKAYGKAYAEQVIKNAKAMGKALDENGVPVKCREYGYTDSHQVHLDNSRIQEGLDHTKALEDANIIVDKGTRIGTCEVTRRGMKEGEMERAAELIARLLVKREPPERVKKEVSRLRSEFETLEYCFKE